MKEERFASVALFLFAAAYLAMALLGIPEPSVRQVLGPEAFPRVIGALMVLLAGLYVLQTFRGAASEDEERAAVIGADEKLGTLFDFKTVATMLGLMLAYAFLFEPLGYPIATLLMFCTSVAVLDRRHWVRDLIIALFASFGLYFVFSFLLRVQLPAGPLRLLGL